MENVNPSSLSLRNELFHLEKKTEVELWLENNRSVDSLVSLENEFEEEEEDDLEYFDTFPNIEELGVRGLKVFVRNFTYECDFVVLEDTTIVIDHYLRGMVLGNPFVKESKLVYDKDEGTVIFDKEKPKSS
ncbi:hypothetical protein Tco_0834677 [Tanacetum coccineum]